MESKTIVESLFGTLTRKVHNQLHSFPIRQRKLDKFNKRTLRKIVLQEGITLVIGELKQIEKLGLQSIIFDLDKWEKNEAKRWYRNNCEKLKLLLAKELINGDNR